MRVFLRAWLLGSLLLGVALGASMLSMEQMGPLNDDEVTTMLPMATELPEEAEMTKDMPEEEVKDFTDHKVIGAFPSSPDEIEYLRNLQQDPKVDVWNDPLAEYEKVSIHLSPNNSEEIEKKLRDHGIDYYIMTDNLQSWIDKERRENVMEEGDLSGRGVEGFTLNTYHRLPEIISYIASIAEKYPNVSKMFDIGQTHNGNKIRGIKVGTGNLRVKPAIVIDAGIHAREWVASASALYMLTNLITNYGIDSELTQLVDTFDFYFLPMVNPDGYEYTWSSNRLWRKNRSPSSSYNRQCLGTDPNRNFQANFGGAGTSGNPCSDVYHGPRAFSERESQAIREVVLRLKNRIKAYFTIHSFSQLWLTPYGYARGVHSAHHSDLQKASKIATDAIQRKHGMNYRYGPVADVLYAATGSSADWAHDVGGVKYSFILELRDQGQQGFLLPKEQIIPTAEESWEGIKSVVQLISNEIKTNKLKSKKV